MAGRAFYSRRGAIYSNPDAIKAAWAELPRAARELPSNALCTARTILEDSPEYCARRLAAGAAEVAEGQQRRADSVMRAHLDHRLARSLAQYLGGMDRALKAVYLYGQGFASDGKSVGTTVTGPLHLIVWAQPRTVALDSLLTRPSRIISAARVQIRELLLVQGADGVFGNHTRKSPANDPLLTC